MLKNSDSDDEVFYELIDHVLVADLVPVWRDGHKCWSKADGKIVRVHHVFITRKKMLLMITSLC